MKRLQRQIFPFLPVVIAPFILMSQVLISGKAIYWGTPSLQFVPWRAYAWEIIKSGHLPLWNPLLGMGAPLLANYQIALIYPPNWTYFLLDFIGGIGLSAWGQALIVAMHLAWAGVGMIFLTRRMGLNIFAQTLAGLSFGLSGYIVSRSGFLSINAAVAWLPWVIFATHNLMLNEQSKSSFDISFNVLAVYIKNLLNDGQRLFVRSYIVLILVITLQLLTGHAQTAWYTMVLSGLWTAYLSFVNVYQRKHMLRDDLNDNQQTKVIYKYLTEIVRNWIILSSAFIAAFALAAIQLIPTAEYLYNSQRATAVGYEFAMSYSFWPWHALTLFAPELFGSPVTGDYWGYGYYWEDAIYIGLLPLILAITEIFQTLSSRKYSQKNSEFKVSFVEFPIYRKSFVIFLLLIISLSSILALGKNTTIYPWLYHHVPSFSLFQAPTRFTIWGVFALVILAALGINEWSSLGKRGLYWVRLATAGSLAVTIGAGLTLFLIKGINPTFIRAAAFLGLNGFIIGVLALTNPYSMDDPEDSLNSRKLQIWRGAVILFVTINLLSYGWGLVPGVELEFYTKTPITALKIKSDTEELRLYMPYRDEDSLKFDRFKRKDTYHPGEDWSNLRAVMLPNLTLLDHISTANNFDPLVPSRYANWMELLQDLQTEEYNPSYLKLLNLMGVGMVETIDSSEKEIGVQFSPVEGSKRFRLLPCAFLASNKEDALDQVIRADFDFENTVIIEGAEKGIPSDCNDSSNAIVLSEFSILHETPNRLDLKVVSNFSGWLVVSDVWYPGWYALVDSTSKPIYHANYLFRAIFVEQGIHNISFVYQPISFRLGIGLSVVAWLVLIGWLVRNRKHEYSKP